MYESERKNGTAGQKVLEEGNEPFRFHNQSDEIKSHHPHFSAPRISIYAFIHVSIHRHAIFCFAFKSKKSISISCAVAFM